MLTCAHCHHQNPEGTSRCENCGIALGHQVRAKADLAKQKTGRIVRTAVWLVVLIIAAVAAPRVYRASLGVYYRQHLKSATAKANSDCDGPVTDDMPAYQKEKIGKCLATNETLMDAQKLYDDYLKGDK